MVPDAGEQRQSPGPKGWTSMGRVIRKVGYSSLLSIEISVLYYHSIDMHCVYFLGAIETGYKSRKSCLEAETGNEFAPGE